MSLSKHLTTLIRISKKITDNILGNRWNARAEGLGSFLLLSMLNDAAANSYYFSLESDALSKLYCIHYSQGEIGWEKGMKIRDGTMGQYDRSLCVEFPTITRLKVLSRKGGVDKLELEPVRHGHLSYPTLSYHIVHHQRYAQAKAAPRKWQIDTWHILYKRSIACVLTMKNMPRDHSLELHIWQSFISPWCKAFGPWRVWPGVHHRAPTPVTFGVLLLILMVSGNVWWLSGPEYPVSRHYRGGAPWQWSLIYKGSVTWQSAKTKNLLFWNRAQRIRLLPQLVSIKVVIARRKQDSRVWGIQVIKGLLAMTRSNYHILLKIKAYLLRKSVLI